MLGLALPGLAAVPQAATTERVVVDRHTGLAIYGIDPVAYFTNGKPTAGREDFELRHAGAVWRFENEGNKAAFAADPQVYMPRFGGYDPVGISRGLAQAGYPALWVVSDQRLYLFYTAEARTAFLANPADAVAGAQARWSAVKSELAE
ncbi:MAG: YHS domain-containing (seleno)protein [Alphaproteobacteria bacterium]